MFRISNCIIRLARQADKADLLEIAKTIWHGSDYLPQIIDRWIKERWFFVAEYQGKVIGCIKLSQFPDKVIWIEGLRVHRRYQSKGVGTLLNDYIMQFCYRLQDKDRGRRFEFCTYYRNTESLRMTSKLGFKQVQSYFNLERKGCYKMRASELLKDYDMSIFELYLDYIPIGWQMVHNCPDSLNFIRGNAIVFRSPQALYLINKAGSKSVTLLSPPVEDLQAELPYLQYFFGHRYPLSITLPISQKAELPRLKELGFWFWDQETEPVENMLVHKL